MYSLFMLATLAVVQVFSMPVNKRSEGRGVVTSCNRPGVFALTFDDGPYAFSYKLASTLQQKGVRATFFITGQNWVNVENDSVETEDGTMSYLNVIRHVHEMGHELASHTFSHRVLSGESEETIKEQMDLESDVIYKAIGERPAIMRPPQGDVGPREINVLEGLGYTVVNWDLNTNDWSSHDIQEEKEAYMRAFEDQSIGHISLQHEVYEQTVEELVPWAVDYVKKQGVEFVTVSDCLGVPAYQ